MYSRSALSGEYIRPAGSGGSSMLCCSLPCGRWEWPVLRHNWTSLIRTLIHVAVFDGIVWACILVDACVCWLGYSSEPLSTAHRVLLLLLYQPHHLGATSLGGDAIQLWRSGRRNHITWVLPVWVEMPFSCDGQGGGTTSPGCCQSGWRRHSAVIVWAEVPPHLGAASLGGEAI